LKAFLFVVQSEAIPESLKNMLLVMHTAGILQHSDENDESKLWKLTWDRIDAFLPGLRDEVFKPHEPGLFVISDVVCYLKKPCIIRYLVACGV
jgi:hypothetical protein